MISDPNTKIGRPRQLFTGSVKRDVPPSVTLVKTGQAGSRQPVGCLVATVMPLIGSRPVSAGRQVFRSAKARLSRA